MKTSNQTTMEKKIYARCKVAGTLLIDTPEHPTTKDGFVMQDNTNALEHYTFTTPQKLVEIANTYDYVVLNGDKIKGNKIKLEDVSNLF